MNLRPPGYEPDELPDCSTPRQYKMGGEGFEPSKLSQQIYSLPPLAARESTHKAKRALKIEYVLYYNQISIERR